MTSDSTSYPLLGRRPRLTWVDAAKCVAVIATAFGHTAGLPYLSPVVTWLDNMLLPLFWVVAGYTSSPGFSLARRFRAIMVPYMWMSLICLVYTVIVSHGNVPGLWWAGILYGRFRIMADAAGPGGIRLMDIHNAVLWFLPSLFTGYALYRAILAVRSLRLQALTVALCLLVASLTVRLPVLLPWGLDLAFFVAPLMWCGGLVRRFDILNRYPWQALFVCAPVYVLFNYLTGPTNYSLRDYGAYGPVCAFCCALPGALAFLVLFRAAAQVKILNCISRWLASLNTESLYIFGLQLLFFNLATHLTTRLACSPTLTVTIQLLLAVAGGYLSGKIINYSGHCKPSTVLL